MRDRDKPHPLCMIWGTLEARVQGADLLILGGLNEGSWPEAARPDPWLNREMRLAAGLLLPERRVGLSAHDFQQAIAAKEVVLSRSVRSDEAETVPSRWLARLEALTAGTPLATGLQPDGRWIDWSPRSGKRPGGFCSTSATSPQASPTPSTAPTAIARQCWRTATKWR